MLDCHSCVWGMKIMIMEIYLKHEIFVISVLKLPCIIRISNEQNMHQPPQINLN